VATDLERYRAQLNGSEPEEALAWQLKAADIPFVQQFHFGAGWTPPRKYAADFAIVDKGSALLVEVDGGSWVAGRHNRGAGFEKDRERDALALIHGWRVLRVTPKQVESGEALGWIEKALE
jgi:very-short-patch-repair endonuclease